MQDRGLHGTQLAEGGGGRLQLFLGGVALEGQHLAVGTQQRDAPGGQPVQRCHGTGRHHVDRGQLAHDLFGTAADHGHMVQAEQFDDLREEVRPPQQRLQQGDLQVLADQGERDPGQTGAGTDVADRHALGHDLGEHRAVQQVPLPQARHLTRADEPPLHSCLGQELGVPDRIREAIAEYVTSMLGSRGELSCLRHGDRPSVPHRRVERRPPELQADKVRPRLRNRRGRRHIRTEISWATRRRSAAAPRPRTRCAVRRP
ncbi:hypothetical protein SGLAM104S_06105 [Streptomyces glaucescens]